MKRNSNPPAPPTIPIRRLPPPATWTGTLLPKPWDHLITAVIPCLDHATETAACIRLLQLQTCRPHIILVDTGSTAAELHRLDSLRRTDVELHMIRRAAVRHPCDLIASALDLGFSLADTPYVFTTHQDCFLRNRHFLQHLVDNIHGLAAIGYQLTPRHFPEWHNHLGHTATLFSLTEYDRLGLTWSLRRAAFLLGHGRPHNPHTTQGSIDTEAAINTLMNQRAARIAFVGTECNHARTLDDNIDHCRSLVCSSLYNADHHAQATAWTKHALTEARQRIKAWENSGPADPLQAPTA